MVRFFYFFIFLFLINSCSSYKTNENGLPRVPSQRFSKLEEISSWLSNDSLVFKSKAVFSYSENNKIEHYRLDESLRGGVGVLRFYNNNKVSLFHIDSIHKNEFNPKKGFMGFYGKKKDKLFVELFFHGDAHGGYLSKRELIIYAKDSIVLLDNVYASVYLTAKVPKEVLREWKPDW